jgi:aldehyde:ferredoxin oxidoreductase
MDVMKGFYSRLLNIDLTQKRFEIETIDQGVFERFLGGKGLASHILYKRNPPNVDPLDPSNLLMFATGPVTQSAIWGSCRYGVYTKSPQTGFYSESYSGGKVPEAIDATGFDLIVISGCSESPAVLKVSPTGAEFFDAGNIWGMDTYAAEDALHQRFAGTPSKYERSGAVVIGPAGENGVRFAVIENDRWRSAGRTGVGTVMGSKQLKGILFQGDRRRELHDEKAVKSFARKISADSKDNPGVKAYKSMGTPMMVKVLNSVNAFPTRYWQDGSFENWEKISADALHERCDVTPHACLRCMMACGRMTTIVHGRHAGLKLEGPEYETIYAFGGLCMIDQIEEIAFLNDICDRLGMDTITAGNLCAFAIEAARRGKIKDHIDYGDVDAIADLLVKIARREGIGDTLAQGIRVAARAWDLEDIAVHVKGMEPAGYDPRVLKGMGLAYATSDRGACHLRATFYKPELAGLIPPDQIEGKAEMFIDFEDRLTLFDALILCRFYRDLYPWEMLEEMIGAVTGIEADKQKLAAIAAAISTQVRRFNIREGLTFEDDGLSKGLYKSLSKTGAYITEQELNQMIQDYYRLRGWDGDGIPTSG